MADGTSDEARQKPAVRGWSLALARLLRKFFQNLRYGRERPKVARKLRSLAGGGVSDTKVAKNDAIVLPSHLYGKLLIPYTVSTYH